MSKVVLRSWWNESVRLSTLRLRRWWISGFWRHWVMKFCLLGRFCARNGWNLLIWFVFQMTKGFTWATAGWLHSRTDINLKEMKRHGEAGSADKEIVERERDRIWDLIKTKGYAWNDIFNMDETGLFYVYVLWPFPVSSDKYKFPIRLPPDWGLSDKKHSGVKGRKVRLTYALTSNASGSEKREPFVIGKAHKPRAFNKKSAADLGFLYQNNAKAWMIMSLYQEWIRAWDRELDLKREIFSYSRTIFLAMLFRMIWRG